MIKKIGGLILRQYSKRFMLQAYQYKPYFNFADTFLTYRGHSYFWNQCQDEGNQSENARPGNYSIQNRKHFQAKKSNKFSPMTGFSYLEDRFDKFMLSAYEFIKRQYQREEMKKDIKQNFQKLGVLILDDPEWLISMGKDYENQIQKLFAYYQGQKKIQTKYIQGTLFTIKHSEEIIQLSILSSTLSIQIK